jgi:hypothetical protein
MKNIIVIGTYEIIATVILFFSYKFIYDLFEFVWFFLFYFFTDWYLGIWLDILTYGTVLIIVVYQLGLVPYLIYQRSLK